MTVAIVRFGGSNCDRDAARALAHLGIEAELVWYEDGLPEGTTGVLLPGGFSYGDYLRAGAMAARTPIMDEVREAVSDGVPLLGVCNGAQIGCESGLTPGTFTVNESARFQCEPVSLRVENAETPWTRAYEEGEVIELPIAHGEGRFEATEEELTTLEREGRILFRYCDSDGEPTESANPNGSAGNVAGVVGESERVAVLMPHPERATLPDLGRTDGAGVLRGFAES
jgi:phosphoribosylformylglycinamidine synthase subunit PurQ / glutaminase